MTGICGFIASGKDRLDLSALLASCHPGKCHPDAHVHSHRHAHMAVATGHDTSLAITPDGRYACVFDGDLFNRDELDRSRNPGRPPGDQQSAANTILNCYLQAGTDTFRSLRGGFTAAILDGSRNEIILGRDMFGIKTMFAANTPHGTVFSSSLASLAKTAWFDRKIGMSGFLEYLACGYVSAPWTIYENARALKPGEYVVCTNNELTAHNYHSLEPTSWRFNNVQGVSEDKLTDQLDKLITQAIARRLPPDGDLSVYLSGGLDTSLLCAKIKEQAAGRQVVAYTLGFPGHAHDETPYAAEVARHLGVEHKSHYLSKDDFVETVSLLPETYGQPFADISAVPTSVIAGKVAEDSRSVFSGDGPDFLFGNFDLRLLHYYYKLAGPRLRGGVAALVRFVTQRFMSARTSPNLDVSELLRQPELFWIFPRMFKSDDLAALIGEPVYAESFWAHKFLAARKDIPPAERLRLAQYLCYGISDVLYKSSCVHDKHLVSFLCPFYDMDLYPFIQYLPTKYKFRHFYGKHLHKRLLYRMVPRHLLERPKRGFVMDFMEFGVEPIKTLTDKYLSKARLGETGLIDAAFAAKCVTDYYAGNTNMGPKLWTLLMFEMWRDKFNIVT